MSSNQWQRCTSHLPKTKKSFSLKVIKTKQGQLVLFVVLVFWGCATNIYQEMAISSPDLLVSLEDSLLQSQPSSAIISSIVFAHKTLGKEARDNEKYEDAIGHYSRVLKLSPNDTASIYNTLMIQGHILYRSGKKDKLWDAIQIYNKAAIVLENLGEPHYYIGKSYHKISDKDFDLILESFEKALSLNLDDDLKLKVDKRYNRVKSRKKNLDNFWK